MLPQGFYPPLRQVLPWRWNRLRCSLMNCCVWMRAMLGGHSSFIRRVARNGSNSNRTMQENWHEACLSNPPCILIYAILLCSAIRRRLFQRVSKGCLKHRSESLCIQDQLCPKGHIICLECLACDRSSHHGLKRRWNG